MQVAKQFLAADIDRSAVGHALLDVVGTTKDTEAAFIKLILTACTAHGQVSLPAPLKKVILDACATTDPHAEITRDRKGDPVHDPDLRDTENVPLAEDIDTYMAREVLPHVPDAWVDRTKTKIGYEIPFTRHFYKYIPPRPLAEIDADIDRVEAEIRRLLRAVQR